MTLCSLHNIQGTSAMEIQIEDLLDGVVGSLYRKLVIATIPCGCYSERTSLVQPWP
jgi:hypothetical protein